MKHLSFVGVFLFLVSHTECRERSFTLVADINANGIVGSIAFTQADRLYPVAIRTEVQPHSYSGKLGWEIHEMPTLWDYSDEVYCTLSVFQSRLVHNLTERHGNLESRALYSDEFMSITSFKESVAGYSLVILDQTNRPISCSTILPLSTPLNIMKAEFSHTVAGEMYFIPYFDVIFKKTLIIGSIYKVDGISAFTGYEWHVGSKVYTPYEFDCKKNLGNDTVFDPTRVKSNASCQAYSGEKCVIGDLQSKHGMLNAGIAFDWSTARTFLFKDNILPLDGVNSIEWRALYLVDQYTKKAVSCAIIKPVEELKYKVELRKSFSYNERKVFGVVYFKQITPYHSTYAKIRVKEHEDMTLDKVKPPTFALYDLFPIGVDCNTIGNIVVDKEMRPRLLLASTLFEDYKNDSIHAGIIEIGFITGFTLSGPKSILSKSVAMFERFPMDSTPQYCGQILPAKSEEVVALIANFNENTKINGYILMIQHLYNKNMQFTDTIIIIDLENRDSYITTGHKFHIHEDLIQFDDQNGTDECKCSKAGPHFNPLNVSTAAPMYGSECKRDFQKRCEVGDLDGKHQVYDIGRARKVFSDSNLNLFGVNYSHLSWWAVGGDKLSRTVTGRDMEAILKFL